MDHSPSSYSTPPPSLEPPDQEGSFWPTDASSTFRCFRYDHLKDSEGGNTIIQKLKILEKDQMTSFVMDLPKFISLTLKFFFISFEHCCSMEILVLSIQFSILVILTITKN